MHRLIAMITIGVLAAGTAAHAAQVTQTITTTASPEAVWSIVGAFPDIATWLPVAASSPADRGSDVGSVRIITLKAPGAPTITEKLTAIDPASRSYSYAIVQVDPKVLPVTGYTSTLSVTPHGTGSVVTWTGHFAPAGGETDAAAEKTVRDIYTAGLAHVNPWQRRTDPCPW